MQAAIKPTTYHIITFLRQFKYFKYNFKYIMPIIYIYIYIYSVNKYIYIFIEELLI